MRQVMRLQADAVEILRELGNQSRGRCSTDTATGDLSQPPLWAFWRLKVRDSASTFRGGHSLVFLRGLSDPEGFAHSGHFKHRIVQAVSHVRWNLDRFM